MSLTNMRFLASLQLQCNMPRRNEFLELLNAQQPITIPIVPSHQAKNFVLLHPEALKPQKSINIFQRDAHLALTAFLLDAPKKVENLKVKFLRQLEP